jgi:hypothetical protein
MIMLTMAKEKQMELGHLATLSLEIALVLDYSATAYSIVMLWKAS